MWTIFLKFKKIIKETELGRTCIVYKCQLFKHC